MRCVTSRWPADLMQPKALCKGILAYNATLCSKFLNCRHAKIDLIQGVLQRPPTLALAICAVVFPSKKHGSLLGQAARRRRPRTELVFRRTIVSHGSYENYSSPS